MFSQFNLSSRIVLVAACGLVTACGSKAAECPPAEAPHITAADVSSADTRVDARKKELEDQVRTLIAERDASKQWASEEQQRQEKEMRLHHRRNGLEAEVWQKLEDIDPKMEDVQARLKKWNVQNPNATQEVMSKAMMLRGRIKKDMQRIHSEPDANFDSLKTELEGDLDSLWSLLQSPALAR